MRVFQVGVDYMGVGVDLVAPNLLSTRKFIEVNLPPISAKRFPNVNVVTVCAFNALQI